MHRILIFAVLGTAMLAGWPQAAAGQAEEDIRWIDRQGSSSTCIGSPASAVCAVETHIACRLRDDDALCTEAGGLEPKYFRPKGATVLYTIDRIRRWEPPEHSPRNSLFVTVWTAESTDLPLPGAADPGSAYIARPAFVAVSYTVERLRGQWRVVSRTERP